MNINLESSVEDIVKFIKEHQSYHEIADRLVGNVYEVTFYDNSLDETDLGQMHVSTVKFNEPKFRKLALDSIIKHIKDDIEELNTNLKIAAQYHQSDDMEY